MLVNCEYRLYVLNQPTPLRNNPFLSHWVEAIQRLEKGPPQGEAAAAEEEEEEEGEEDGSMTGADVNTVRVELIKALLQSRNPSQFARTTPRQLHRNYVEMRQTSPFNIKTYVRMLEEEGIYERKPGEVYGSRDGSPGRAGRVAGPGAGPGSKLNEFQRWKLGMLSRLETEPDAAIPELTHLPIELSYLDFLTTLLQERTLQSLAIEPAPVIADYLQHALRLTEQMGQPPDLSGASALNGEEEGGREPLVVVDHGREAQTRAVRLLLLFIRNLIRKALLPLESIFFEIQEICVRYVWIREVREFRAFVEEGVGSEEQGVG